MKKHFLIFILFLFLAPALYSQAPQSIPYQAVVRNTDGSNMANAAVTITFKIHDNSATGTVVYEETHATTTNAQGLVSLNVGGGTVVTGTFSGIQWGTGSKFLHVLMNAGNGIVDLGTQQMMSVPYALYAEEVNVRVSVTGDSLFIGDQVSIVPGVSAANPLPLYTMGNGVNDIDGNYYPSIIINGQEWMQQNLRVEHFSDGTAIVNLQDDLSWTSAITPAYCTFDNADAPTIEGYLYNAYAVISGIEICPVGWRVPNDNDWYQLINFLGGEWEAGGKMKSTVHWSLPNVNATNLSGFNAVGTGLRYDHGGFGNYQGSATWYGDGLYENGYSIRNWTISAGLDDIYPLSSNFNKGFSIRCIKN